MQLTESVFFLVVLALILRLLFPGIRRALSPSYSSLLGLATLFLLLAAEGIRWQIAPALLAFILLALWTLKNSETKYYWRVLASVPLTTLLFISVALAFLLPVFSLPKPQGPYAIGTFAYNLEDPDRIERFDPSKKRELAIRVWYPSSMEDLTQYEVRTLWGDLYTGSFDLIKLFTSHLRLVNTNSYVDVPISLDEQFPVLIFNHGMMSTPEQNTILVEHLVSNGYVVCSIARTFQSTKVFLQSSEKVLFTTQLPVDLGIENSESRSTAGVRQYTQRAENGTAHSQLDERLFSLFDSFQLIESDAGKMRFVADVLENRETYLIGNEASPETLLNYFDGRMTAMGSIAQTWVEDISTTVDRIGSLEAPIDGFVEAIDSENLGVFGHSFGSVAVGEFCKLDKRCDAGIHIDGNYQGYNWDEPLLAPFLVMYSSNFYLGNEFAYKNSGFDFWNMTVEGIDHLDFTDLGLIVRGISGPGVMGEIDNYRAIQIVNDVTLSFFDHYLKNKPMRSDLQSVYPDLILSLRE